MDGSLAGKREMESGKRFNSVADFSVADFSVADFSVAHFSGDAFLG